MTDLQTLYEELLLTSVFKGVTEKPLFCAFFDYMKANGDRTKMLSAYARFVSEIYENGGDLTALVTRYVFLDENLYVKAKAQKKTLSPHVENAAHRELSTFSLMAALSPDSFSACGKEMPQFSSSPVNLLPLYEQRMTELSRYGYGIFSSTCMFRVADNGDVEPIASADKIAVDRFVGYEEERQRVIDNTEAFVTGRPAANTLLCGDAGTGKSSTVKAVANLFFDRGVRLIELRKDQLGRLPYVMGKITGNPLRFIIFIDDLSFNGSDDNFSMLKAALEGSASARAENAVIYATSNRRHIVRESFSDREGSDVHRNDTVQETLSLSERFGLTVLFSKPDKKLYLTIVHELADRYGVKTDRETLDIAAEAFALRRGYRSARCAEQFIESLV